MCNTLQESATIRSAFPVTITGNLRSICGIHNLNGGWYVLPNPDTVSLTYVRVQVILITVYYKERCTCHYDTFYYVLQPFLEMRLTYYTQTKTIT